MKTSWLVAALLMMGSGTASAEYVDGNQLRMWARSAEHQLDGRVATGKEATEAGLYVGYIEGVVDSLSEGKGICPPAGSQVSQMQAIVTKYLAMNPEKWSQPGPELVLAALQPVFPCGK